MNCGAPWRLSTGILYQYNDTLSFREGDEGKLTSSESDLDPGDAQRMSAGTGVVVASVGLVLDLDAVGLVLGFQVAPLRQRKVLENRTMGVAGAPLAYRSLLSTNLQPHSRCRIALRYHW